MHIVSRVGIGKIPPASPLYLDVGGAVNFDTTLRVIGQTTVNALISSQLASNTLVYESRIVGETNVLFSINRDGKLEWGDGGILTTDTNLYRSAINTLRTNSSLIIDQSLIVGDDTSDTATFNARISSNFDPSINDTYSLGQTSLRWQNLWLSVKLTSVDGLFTGDLQVENNTILGSDNSDTLTVNAFISSQLTPFTNNLYDLGSLGNKWRSLYLGTDLQVDGNTILGDSNLDALTINAFISSQLTPFTDNLYDLGSLVNRWRSLYLGTDLQVDNNTILGSDNSDTLTINAFISSQLTPTTDNVYDLGSLVNRWRSLYLGSNLQVDGNTILGDGPSDTITANAKFSSALNPSIDDFYNLGTSAFRWKNINLGPEGVIVRNDSTNTEKASLYFSSGATFLQTSPTVSLILTTGINSGILVDSTGKVGINYSSGLTENFNVNGTSSFSDIAYFNKSSGYGLKVTAVAGIEGSLESANTEKYLNIGINPETEFINIGTSSLAKTINIGTGSGKSTINIGGPSDIININGTVTTTQTIESFVVDKTLSLNVGGLNSTAQNSGLLVEEASATLLSASNPTWQSGNTVRYLAVNTGDIKIGSVVLISGFSLPQNNGQFTVTGLLNNTYFEVQNTQVNNSAFDEVTVGSVTNPSVPASILITTDRSGWNITSPLNSANYFRLSNYGADVELKSTTSGLTVVSTALLPETANTPLGSVAKPWDAFFNNTTIYGDTIIGDASSDTVTINATSSFVGNVNSNIIPNANKNLGSATNEWENLYVKNVTASVSLSASGTITLGSSNTTTINVGGEFNSSLIPKTSLLSLGSALKPWNEIYVNDIWLPTFTAGSVLFVDSSSSLTENNSQFFWKNDDARLYIGQNTGLYALDIAKNAVDSIRLRNTINSSAIAINANTSSTKIEYTDKLQFGVNSYVDVGNGASTALLELTDTSVNLLGAVSVNSVAISTATYIVQSKDVIINIDTSTSGCVITLPTAAVKRLLIIKDIGNNASASGRAIQLLPTVDEYVEFNSVNVPFIIERDGESVTLQSDGNNRWYII